MKAFFRRRNFHLGQAFQAFQGLEAGPDLMQKKFG
jgi:hypothetical protein